jgi:predicted ArsR family transcriptional regulator
MSKEELVYRIVESIAGGKNTSSQLAEVVKLPQWKVARLLKRLEKLGFLKSSQEIKFTPGRPSRIYSLTETGMKFFAEKGVKLVSEEGMSSDINSQKTTSNAGSR